ncbi:MAG TPA: hypothetical protein VHS29_02705 [Candidatus Acidoferrales bacterium]|jgi:hypothetical protein|nr:hypothetical protein [Candidatus Acidoferrales bacterium]
MRGNKFLRVLKFVAIGIVAFTVFGFVVTNLWNYLMPGLFGLHAITFWQAVGLMLLGRLLFGGFRPGRGGFGWRGGEMRRRWESMTPEEREKFREGMRGRCGTPRTTAAQTNQ